MATTSAAANKMFHDLKEALPKRPENKRKTAEGQTRRKLTYMQAASLSSAYDFKTLSKEYTR